MTLGPEEDEEEEKKKKEKEKKKQKKKKSKVQRCLVMLAPGEIEARGRREEDTKSIKGLVTLASGLPQSLIKLMVCADVKHHV